jgi:hypothetical protein
MSLLAFHFVNTTLRDGRPVPPDGAWLEHAGPIKICRSGLHASRHVADAMQHAPGTTLCYVELGDIAEEQDDKVVARRRKIIARFDATALLRADALASALSVIHLWKAPGVVRKYLETGDEALRVEARNASANAADDAANAAVARAAAHAAAAADAAVARAAAAAYGADAHAAYAYACAAYAADDAANACAAYAAAHAGASANAASAARAASANAASAGSAAAPYGADAHAAPRREHREASRARLLAAVTAKFAEMGVML